MDSINIKAGDKTIKLDDSLNSNGSEGVDFWQSHKGCDTLLFALDVDAATSLAKWLVNYLSENSEHHKNRK